MPSLKPLAQAQRLLDSPRLTCRAVALGDAGPLFAATHNPLFNRHLLRGTPVHVAKMRPRLVRSKAQAEAAGVGTPVAGDKQNRLFVQVAHG